MIGKWHGEAELQQTVMTVLCRNASDRFQCSGLAQNIPIILPLTRYILNGVYKI